MNMPYYAPNVTFAFREGDEAPEDGGCPIGGVFVNKTSHELFAGKRVIIFSLPGAFTPTCSTYQLPGFEEKYDEFRALGIDEIYCVSVNDAFVMNEWARQLGIKKVKMLPDGNGDFTRLMGMLVSKSQLGFGMRSHRYAAILTDRVRDKLFVEEGREDNFPADPYGESSPEKVLEYLKQAQ
jgi:peroxiredoxin